MTTRLELRNAIRGELNDGGPVYLWPDARLDRWIAEAVRDYGRHLPREASAVLTSVGGQASYALPTGARAVLRVEYPSGVLRAERPSTGAEDGGGPAYEVYGGELVLAPAPEADGEEIKVRYLAEYAAPTTDGETLATPPADDDLLVWFVCARALQWLGTDEAKRQRYERQRGASTLGAAQQYAQDYWAAVRRRQRRMRMVRLRAE